MDFSISGLWASMGLFAKGVVVLMGLMSLASLVVLVERLLVFNRASSESRAFAVKMGAVLSKGDVEKAAAMEPGKEIGHLGRVISAGLHAFAVASGGKAEFVFESVARALERQSARETQSFKRGLSVLATVGSTVPFVGLAGTIAGIVNSFQMMAASGSGGLGTVSAGIAEALITTLGGLFVAIPAVMAYNFLQGWVDARGVDMSESANELLDVVARHLEGPGGKAEAEAAE